MRLRDRRAFEKPEVMIIPMIDIMFFLLVFFIMSTLYMVNLKTVDVNLPKAQTAQTQLNVTYLGSRISRSTRRPSCAVRVRRVRRIRALPSLCVRMGTSTTAASWSCWTSSARKGSPDSGLRHSE